MEREKVIKGLECCIECGAEVCTGCPYCADLNAGRWHCRDLRKDALALLKAQDETRLVRHFCRPNVYADLWQHCEKCGEKVDLGWHPKYCPGCGRAVKWDG